MSKLIGTGVFATKKEAKEIREAFNLPVISFNGFSSIGGNPRKLLHTIALSHGLPEIQGYYGIKKDGEFVKI